MSTIQEYKTSADTGAFITRTIPKVGSNDGYGTTVVEVDLPKVAFNQNVIDRIAALEAEVNTAETGILARLDVLEEA